MSRLGGWVASWTDGSSEVTILSAWTLEDEAKAACQQDVRDGEDMGAMSGPDAGPVAEDERHVLEWEDSPQIGGATADCGNGQGTYFVHKLQ